MSKTSKYPTQCFIYDFTLKADDFNETFKDDIITQLRGYCKHFVFQFEKGDTGFLHYQGRISLIKKRRLHELIKLFSSVDIFSGIHLSITSNPAKNDTFYVTKTDTRVHGPWSDKDNNTESDSYIPKQIRCIDKLHPWQNKIIELSNIWDTRSVHIIVDEIGNNGKSTLCMYMDCHNIGTIVPMVNDYKDLMRIIYDMPTSKCYLIDMPRAINKEKLFQFFGAIESIKNGYVFDDRYHFKKKHFDCPNIFIFSNRYPDTSLLSADRWVFWTITSFELVHFEKNIIDNVFD